MDDIYHEHIKITDEVKQSMNDLKIVFPAQYGKLYTQSAKKFQVELAPEHLIDHEMLDERIVRHIISLSVFAENAVTAMETGDKKRLIEVIEETKELREEIRELQKLVYEDTLTKVFNRRWFEDSYLKNDNTVFSKAGSLVIIDIDRFKRINDAYGHVIGDKVLVHVAEKLKEINGKIVRYGGDEFIVVFASDVRRDEIDGQIDRLTKFFDKVAFKLAKGEFKVTFSYGVATFEEEESFLSVIDAADQAMYQNKGIQGSFTIL